MTSKPSALRLLWRRLFSRATPAPTPPARLERADGTTEPRPLRTREGRPVGIEPLEGRIAPAALLPGGTDLSYTDADHDVVTIHFSKAIFNAGTTAATNSLLDSVFTFSAGDAHSSASTPQQLQKINFGGLDPAHFALAAGVSFSVSVQAAGGGDGHVNVGAIEAAGLRLGSVSIAGDLGHINAGVNTLPVAVQSLTVESLGHVTGTQTGTASFTSSIAGGLGSFTANLVDGAYLHVQQGGLGTLTITQHLNAQTLVAPASGTAPASEGLIQVDGNIGAIKLGASNATTDDALTGGAGNDGGSIIAGGGIGSITVTGQLHGGVGVDSGAITAAKSIGAITVNGSLLGGTGQNSGEIRAGLQIGSAVIGTGSGIAVQGGAGQNSGGLVATSGIGFLHLRGDLVGGSGDHSGILSSTGAIQSIVIDGSVKGGTGSVTATDVYTFSGSIGAHSIGSIAIAGDLIGGDGADSGFIGADLIGSVVIQGKLAGGSADHSGALFAGVTSGVFGQLGSINIAHGLVGGSGLSSGSIGSTGNIGAVTIGIAAGGTSSIVGGSGDASGLVDANGNIGAIHLLGDLTGSGSGSAGLTAGGSIGNVTINGTLRGGGASSVHTGFIEAGATLYSVSVLGNIEGTGVHSGVIASGGTLRSVLVTGHVQGGTGAYSGSISSGFAGAGSVGAVTIHGGLLGGAGDDSGAISAAGNIYTLRLGLTGSTSSPLLVGADGAYSGSIYAAGSIVDARLTGSVQGGAGPHSGSIEAGGQLQLLLVGDLSGASVHAGSVGLIGTTSLASTTITAVDSLARLIVTGNVTGSSILAGYDASGAPANGRVQIGSVSVSGNWKTSNLVAGALDENGNGFGSSDDAPYTPGALSRIASVVIKGTVTGDASARTYGIEATQIGAVSIAGVAQHLTAARDSFAIGSTNVFINEVASVG